MSNAITFSSQLEFGQKQPLATVLPEAAKTSKATLKVGVLHQLAVADVS